MADIAELGLRIRADGAVEAANSLDRVQQSAGRVQRSYTGMATGITSSSRRLSRATSTHRNLGMAAQNASFQIADFAVQVGAGTSATRAFAQQAPQMLGAFGMWGAAAGAAVAVMAGLIPVLMNTGKEAQSTADMLDALGEALDGLKDKTEAARQPFFDLMSDYGMGANQARELLNVQRQLAQIGVADQLQSLQDAVSETFGAFEELRDAETGQTLFSGLETRLLRLRKELGVSGEAAVALQAGLDALATAKGPQDQAEAARRLREELIEAAGGVDLLNAKGRRFLAELLNMEDAALRFAAIDIVTGLSSGADEAARLAQNMFSAATAKAAFAEQAARTAVPENQLGFGLPGVSDPTLGNAELGFGGTSGSRGFVAPAPANRQFEYNPDGTLKLPKGSKGGGGGVSQAERDLERFTSTLEGFRTEGQQAAAQLAELEANFGRFQGQLTPEQVQLYEQAIGELRGTLSQVSDGITDFGREAASVFPSITEIMDDTRDAASRLFATLADRTWQYGIERLFSGFGNSMGATAGGLLGGRIIPGILHDGGIAGVDGYGHGRSVSAAIFANAERYHNGGIAGLRGNEVPAILERGERVVPKGASENINITVVGEEGATFLPRVKNISRGEVVPVVGKAANAQRKSYGRQAQSYQMRGTTT